MDRREIILDGLDLSKLNAIEVGAMSKPLLSRNDCHVLYLDHLGTDAIKQKLGHNPYYDLDELVEVDIVWNGGRLAPLLPRYFAADLIVASHVIEHVPDVVRWLAELESALASPGEIRLAIPDKRFIFDRFRQVTRLSDVLANWVRKDEIPGPQAIIDYQINVIEVVATDIWQDRGPDRPVIPTSRVRQALDAAIGAVERGEYLDAHCWVFTPAVFAQLMADLAELGLVTLACKRFIDTPEGSMEFYVDLVSESDVGRAAGSWRAALLTLRSEPSFEPSDNRTDQQKMKRLENSYAALVDYVNELITRSTPREMAGRDIPYEPVLTVPVTNDLLVRTIWKYRDLASSSAAALVHFLPDGHVGIYSHANEAGWIIENGMLAFLHEDGRKSTIFDQSFVDDGRVILRGRHQFSPQGTPVFVLEQCARRKASQPVKPTQRYFDSEIALHGWTIGEHTYGFPTVFEAGLAGMRIGRFCSIAEDVKIILGNHRVDLVTTYPFATIGKPWDTASVGRDHTTDGDVTIGNDVWIGASATILSGVEIGNGAVIGAGSVVTKDVPAYAIVVGNPSRIVKYRFEPDIIASLEAIRWWSWDDAKINRHLSVIMSSDPTELLAIVSES